MQSMTIPPHILNAEPLSISTSLLKHIINEYGHTFEKIAIKVFRVPLVSVK